MTREWLVGGGIIEDATGVLLVQNRRRNGRVDWSPPGGVIDEGETLVEGLTREVAEETGLVVTEWAGPVYEIVAEAPDLGWRLRVEAFRAVTFTGEVEVDDPDGIVVDACYTPAGGCGDLLVAAPQWVREPLTDWLTHRWEGSRAYGYRVEGTDLGALRGHPRVAIRSWDDAGVHEVAISDDMIRLGQLLQLAGVVDSGSDAKLLLLGGDVTVNGEPESRRGRQLHPGDVVELDDIQLKVV